MNVGRVCMGLIGYRLSCPIIVLVTCNILAKGLRRGLHYITSGNILKSKSKKNITKATPKFESRLHANTPLHRLHSDRIERVGRDVH